MRQRVPLEPAAERVSLAGISHPRIYELPPSEGREVLERAQDTPVYMYPACVRRLSVDTGQWGRIPVYLVIPPDCRRLTDVIFYIHGAGWVFGSFHTHEKLVRELAYRTGCLLVFPEYTRSPEAHYPAAMEQCYCVLCRLPEIIGEFGYRMRPETLTVAGDSVGGNLVIAMTLLSKYRKGPKLHKQLLYYPVANACFDTPSYDIFSEGYYLYRDGMIWFWDQYTKSEEYRNHITASPLRAGRECLEGLPEAMIINGEADVLRDEGEAYAQKLRSAGVPVTAIRFQAMIHDFVMLHSLDQTKACRAAMDVSTEWIKRDLPHCRQRPKGGASL